MTFKRPLLTGFLIGLNVGLWLMAIPLIMVRMDMDRPSYERAPAPPGSYHFDLPAAREWQRDMRRRQGAEIP